jgi:Ca2+-binding RTX toxin-like protein
MTGFASVHGTDYDETIDTTHHGSRNDWIWAKEGDDTIKSGDGNDGIYAGSGKDLVYAGNGHDTVFGQSGNDTVYGKSGNDRIDGGRGNDELDGGSHQDTIIGGKGDDTITGGAGNDLLTGDGASLADGNAPGTGNPSLTNDGEDVFYFDNGFGQDTILDFDLANDTLEIKAGINGMPITDPGDVAGYVSESSGNAVITIGGDSITLVGVSKSDLLAHLNDVVNIV